MVFGACGGNSLEIDPDGGLGDAIDPMKIPLTTTNCDAGNGSCIAEVCGDEKIQAPEVCDGTLLGDATCVSEGYASGTLSCTSD